MALNDRLSISRRATITFTADDWELFDEPGRDRAANDLNKALEDAVNAPGAVAGQIWRDMREMQNRHAQLGADDGEAARIIEIVIDRMGLD